MNSWLHAFLFFLPAGIANATPVLANKIPIVNRWRTSVDFGLSWHGKRLLGANKTWRGIFTGTVLAGFTAVLLQPWVNTSLGRVGCFKIGLLLGFGALLGDAIESMLKRRLGIASGRSWFPFDQLDYILGALLLAAPFTSVPWSEIWMILGLFFGLHLLTAYTAYLLGLKERPI